MNRRKGYQTRWRAFVTTRGERTEWLQLHAGHWRLVQPEGDAQVFRGPRGWAAVIGGKFVDYYPTRALAMEAALEWLRQQATLAEQEQPWT